MLENKFNKVTGTTIANIIFSMACFLVESYIFLKATLIIGAISINPTYILMYHP